MTEKGTTESTQILQQNPEDVFHMDFHIFLILIKEINI